MAATRRPRVVVIGGGISGISAARKLRNVGHKVVLIERMPRFLSGSSNAMACRLGVGHFKDLETSKIYLRNSIAFMRNHPECVLGYNEPANHPHRRTINFIHIDSMLNLSDASKLVDGIVEEYRRLIKEDPANKTFGEPENLIHDLSVGQYKHIVDTTLVNRAFDIAEDIVDFPKLKTKLLDDLHDIDIYLDTEVMTISNTETWTVIAKQKKSISEPETIHKFEADVVINCAYEEIEKLNLIANIHMDPAKPRTNRLKASVLIEAEKDHPDFGIKPLVSISELKKNNDKKSDAGAAVQQKSTQPPPNAISYVYGPFITFIPMGNGLARIHYEPITNIEGEQSTGYEVSAFAKHLLTGQATPEQKDKYSKPIFENVKKYIPGLKAKVKDVNFGIVQTEGTVKLDDPNSDHHKRLDYGIRSEKLGLISAPARKFMFFETASDIVHRIVEEHLKLKKSVQTNATKKSPRLVIDTSKNALQKIDEAAILAVTTKKPRQIPPPILVGGETMKSLPELKGALKKTASPVTPPLVTTATPPRHSNKSSTAQILGMNGSRPSSTSPKAGSTTGAFFASSPTPSIAIPSTPATTSEPSRSRSRSNSNSPPESSSVPRNPLTERNGTTPPKILPSVIRSKSVRRFTEEHKGPPKTRNYNARAFFSSRTTPPPPPSGESRTSSPEGSPTETAVLGSTPPRPNSKVDQYMNSFRMQSQPPKPLHPTKLKPLQTPQRRTVSAYG